MSETENNLKERDDELNKQIEKHPAEESIQVLVKDAKRRTTQLHLLTVIVILTLLLGIGLSIASYKLYQLTKLAQSNRAAVLANCETANDSRTNQRQLWAYVSNLTPDQPRDAGQDERADQFNKFVEKTFAQRDCEAEARAVEK